MPKSKKSAGLLLFREVTGRLEVLLVHPGGPFWAKKDEGAWSLPKGEFEEGEDPFAAAKREFEEETGFAAPHGEKIPLEPLRQPSGKLVYVWAMKADLDPSKLKSNLFSMEWPPKSRKHQEFPEVDQAGWFPLEEAFHKITKGQADFLVQLQEKLGGLRPESQPRGPLSPKRSD